MTTSDRDAKSRRRGGGLRALAASLPKATARALGKRGFAEGALLTEWPSIVGEMIAGRCLPLRLTGRREAGGGTLLLRVAPGFALELQHLEPQLIERINGYFGRRAVQRLKYQQGPLPSLAQSRRRAPPPAPAALSPQQQAALQDKLADVDDEALRAALERLGRAVAQKTSSAGGNEGTSRVREERAQAPAKR